MTPSDLLTLATATMAAAALQPGEQGYVARPAGGITLRAQPKVAGITAGWGTQALTFNERYNRIARAASIMLAESGGNPTLTKGSKRGIWQWDRDAFPAVSDAAALSPGDATRLAFQTSRGFSQFGPWSSSEGLNPNSPASLKIAAALGNMDLPLPDGTTVHGLPAIAIDKIPGVGSILGWADALGTLLSKLIDQKWWIRLGTGALGLVLILIAVSIVTAPTALRVASKP